MLCMFRKVVTAQEMFSNTRTHTSIEMNDPSTPGSHRIRDMFFLRLSSAQVDEKAEELMLDKGSLSPPLSGLLPWRQ